MLIGDKQGSGLIGHAIRHLEVISNQIDFLALAIPIRITHEIKLGTTRSDENTLQFRGNSNRARIIYRGE